MTTVEHLVGQWREWRYAHVAEMFRPYGWTALVAQYWLREGEEQVELDLLPGSWSVKGGKVFYLPSNEGGTLSVNGSHPDGEVEIIPGRNQTYGDGDSVPVYYNDLEVETIVRSTNSDEPLYGVRVRDPKATTSLRDISVDEFDYDINWRLPGRFEAFERVDHEAETVETGVRETTPLIGTFTFEYGGEEYSMVVLGKDTATDIQPVVHFRDTTNGTQTYGAGRVVELRFADAQNTQIDFIDFNYATALPCAFTNFVTCPLPPPSNVLPFEVLAGEKKPETDISRVRTFQD